MKRKVKKYAEGDLVEKEGKGFFGETQKWKEDKEGRKFTDSGNRYYSADDVKSKLSGLFGGKNDEPKKSTTMPSGYEKLDATEGNARTRKIEDYIKKSEPKAEEPAKPAGKTYVNQEYKDEPVKKVVAKKAAPKARSVGTNTADDKPAAYEDTKVKLGSQSFDTPTPPKYKPGISKERQEKADKAVYAGWRKNKIDMTKRKSAEDMKYDEQGNAYKRGGKVKSASARADGCAIRGKTRA
jgi:hypothetical protein